MDRKHLKISFFCTYIFAFVTFSFFFLQKSMKIDSAFMGRYLTENEKRIPLIEDFQKIGTGSEKLYVYSAFYEVISGTSYSIVVVGGLKTKSPGGLYCQLYAMDGFHYATVKATLKDLPADNDYYGHPYQAYYINCKIDIHVHQLPAFVSIIDYLDLEINPPVSNLLLIRRRPKEKKYKFTLCVQPVFSFEDPFRFTEWLEFYLLMGVEKFTLYNISIGAQTSCVIKSYGKVIEVLPWTIPYSANEFRVNGQSLAIHDCLLRHRGVADYLIIVDLDEMIMPNKSNNYSEMVEELKSYYYPSDIVAFLFENAFFWIDKDFGEEIIIPPPNHPSIQNNRVVENVYRNLYLTSKVLRNEFEDGNSARTKYIVVPDRVVELSIHHVLKCIGEGNVTIVPYQEAYLHHYRTCKGLPTACGYPEKVLDNTAHNISERVTIEVADRLYSKCKECKIPPV